MSKLTNQMLAGSGRADRDDRFVATVNHGALPGQVLKKQAVQMTKSETSDGGSKIVFKTD